MAEEHAKLLDKTRKRIAELEDAVEHISNTKRYLKNNASEVR